MKDDLISNPPVFELPTFKYDCDLIDICKKMKSTYKMCHKGASVFENRCSPAQKQSIRQGYLQSKLQLEIQNREDERIKHEEEIQLLRDKSAVRRSWIQLFVAAILGGVCTKLIDWLPAIINWLKALL